MKIHNVIQGTEEWFKVREGKLTASHATAIANNGKGLVTYVEDMVLKMIEKANGKEREIVSNKHTERGHIEEPFARMAFEFETGLKVREVGFIEYTPYSGCSPDGLIYRKKKGLEIKCRNMAKHFSILRTGKPCSNTLWQIQMNMLVTGFDSWWFVAYNENFKQSLFKKLIHKDEAKQEKLRIGIESGTKMLKELLSDPVTIKELGNE